MDISDQPTQADIARSRKVRAKQRMIVVALIAFTCFCAGLIVMR